MHYVSVEGLGKSYGIKPLFSNLDFHISEGDKIALIARNGYGKSTLLRILAGKETPDEGSVWINKEADVVLLEQDPVFEEDRTVVENIFYHDHATINAIRNYEVANETGDIAQINSAIIKMDEAGAWDFEAKVKQVLSRLNVHQLNQPVRSLSGGQRKRIALAKALIDAGFEHKHVLFVMDEPTNHLDVEMVEWLENYLNKENITLLLVTHDRYFLDAVCEEIWELDRSEMHVYKGDYQNYLEKKTARAESETASIEKAKNLYRRELEWMRKQPRARTIKSKSRQDNFYVVEKKAKKQVIEEKLSLDVKMTRLGGKVAELKKVNKQYGDKIILNGFDYSFKKGERIGIIGKNGTGKTTFINILQGIETPDSGKVNIGDTVVFGNYSQKGLEIKENLRVIEYVKAMAESFPLASGGSLSAAQFLELFLFEPDKQYTYVSMLSGGEKRRLHLLAILFRNPNFLVLDEPTNDLDLPTLSVLENFLSEFQGCLVIVSHDRYFMDRLVDHLFVFEGNGKIRDFPGNYSQYREEAEGFVRRETIDVSNKTEVIRVSRTRNQPSFKEKREFEQLEKELQDLQKEKELLSAKLNDSNLPYEELQRAAERIVEVSAILDEKELRWLELSELM